MPIAMAPDSASVNFGLGGTFGGKVRIVKDEAAASMRLTA
jgi:hypothetical protein